MVPRPRNKASKGLPPNLYLDERRGTFRYRRPRRHVVPVRLVTD